MWKKTISFVFPGILLLSSAVESQQWTSWSVRPSPVFSGEHAASDPSIVHDNGQYRMFYTCATDVPSDLISGLLSGLFGGGIRTAICQAVSPDGLSWREAPVQEEVRGLMLKGRPGEWDENLEGSCIVKRDSSYLLYYSGYREEGNPVKGMPAALAVARSSDGRTFTRVSTRPILSPTPGWYDNDAIYSPTIIEDGDRLIMVYIGHCYSDCRQAAGGTLVAATSRDGISWIKEERPVLKASDAPSWARDAVAEPALIKGPDGFFYLFFVGVRDENRVIGVARSASLFGPWTINPNPIITPISDSFADAQVLAPHVEIEQNKVRMWFFGYSKEEKYAIGYAESRWPLYRSDET